MEFCPSILELLQCSKERVTAKWVDRQTDMLIIIDIHTLLLKVPKHPSVILSVSVHPCLSVALSVKRL